MKSVFSYLEQNQCYVDALKNMRSPNVDSAVVFYQYRPHPNSKEKRYNVSVNNQISAERIKYSYLYEDEVTYHCAKGDYNVVTKVIFDNKFFLIDLTLDETNQVIKASDGKPLKRLNF